MTISCATTLAAERPSAAAKPPTISPQMIAANVAPSTSALAADELLAPQVIGQDAVFDRPEKGRDAAESEQRHIEQGRRGEDEARRRDHLDADLGELEPPRDQGLVVRIGDLAAERGQGDRGQDERHRGEQDFHAAPVAAEAEQDQHRQHVADEIVVERRKELAPEQRREAPRRHQGAEHEGPGVLAARMADGRRNPPAASSWRTRSAIAGRSGRRRGPAGKRCAASLSARSAD